MRPPRPVLVLVGGAPGSGKTTLGALLGRRLRLPVVHKDQLREGRLWTAFRTSAAVDTDTEISPTLWAEGFVPDVGAVGPELFYRTLELWLGQGMSAVAESTFHPELTPVDVRERLAPHADLVYVHCVASCSAARWEARCRADEFFPPPVIDELLPLATTLATTLADPLPLGCPTVVVDTSDGYDPPMDELVRILFDLIGRPAQGHELT